MLTEAFLQGRCSELPLWFTGPGCRGTLPRELMIRQHLRPPPPPPPPLSRAPLQPVLPHMPVDQT